MYNTRGLTVCFILMLLFDYSIVNSDGKRRFVDDPDCPRKPELARNRKCLKKCRTDLDCRGRNKRCQCDDVCGRSCVKPTLRCSSLKTILNGKYKIVPFNTFGAKVQYICNDGYVLSGLSERVCQGDGYWSAKPPTCETEGKCRGPPLVENATPDTHRDQTVFPLGAQLTYSCNSGYLIDGFFRAMCVGEGRWVGPRITCYPQRCDPPEQIPHGHRVGKVFVYPNRVTYHCKKGYQLQGRPYRMCQANGKWSGNVPVCKPAECSRLEAPANGHLRGSSHIYGATVEISCAVGYRLIGPSMKRCRHDGVWTGPDSSCDLVDCGLPSPFYNGYIVGQQTTYGSQIKFSCNVRTVIEGHSALAECQANGNWSFPIPKCWSKCQMPRIHNGSISLEYRNERWVEHRTKRTIVCDNGFVPNGSDTTMCTNGTWIPPPICVPASCDERPPDIRDGLMRFHAMNHGDRAKYICNTGFELAGQPEMFCEYGNWTGTAPVCTPVYCDYPGTIDHGQVLLVGVIGKYEYRPYVRKIGHNEVIEYHCEKTYKRIGPAGATCVDGAWSPLQKPKCQPGKHPKMLYIFRGKRSIAADVIHPHKSKHIHTITVDSRLTTKSPQVADIYNKTLSQEMCPAPHVLTNGYTWVIGKYGAYHKFQAHILYFRHGTRIIYACRENYARRGPMMVTCSNGTWSPKSKTYCQTRKRLFIKEREIRKQRRGGKNTKFR